jgi:hypothetical protein
VIKGGALARIIGEGKVCTGVWWGNLRKRDRWEDQGVDGRIILRLSRNMMQGYGLEIWLR